MESAYSALAPASALAAEARAVAGLVLGAVAHVRLIAGVGGFELALAFDEPEPVAVAEPEAEAPAAEVAPERYAGTTTESAGTAIRLSG